MIIKGKVVKGLGLGTKLGFPTANLDCGDIVYPDSGVYAARIVLGRANYNAVVIVGARTEAARPLVEVLLFDFHGDLYGKELEVEILQKISEIKKFDNQDDLVKKIKADIEKADKQSL